MAPENRFCGEHTQVVSKIAALETRQEALEKENSQLRAAVDLLLPMKGTFEASDPEKMRQLQELFKKAGKNYERLRNMEGAYGLLQQTVEGIEEQKKDWITEKMVKEMLKSYDFWIRVGIGGIGVGVLASIAKLLGWM